MKRFCLTSDLHLREDKPERFDALLQVLRISEDNSSDALIIAGDLFDRGHDAPELRTRVRNSIEEFPGKVILLPGNHDMDCYDRKADYGKNAVVLRSHPYEDYTLGSSRIIGVPFQKRVTLGDRLSGLETVPEETILVAHGSLYKGWLETFYEGEEEKGDYLPILESDLRGRFSFVALGHFHSGFAPHEDENALWCYPGTPISLTSKETGRRHVALVEFEPGKGVTSWEKIPLDTPYWKRTSILVTPGKEEEALSRLMESVRTEADEKVRLLLVLSGTTRIGEGELRKQLESRIAGLTPLFAGVEYDFRVVDWSSLLEDPMIEKYADLIANSDEDEEIIEEAMRLGLSAFGKARSK
jgi:DNA repair exonuclease SbcCD nuclease subunit